MIETDVLSRHRPATSGPNLEATERATRAFEGFLDGRARAATLGGSTPTRAPWRKRSLAIAGMAAVLLMVGSVAYATFGDGVFYVKPATQITQTGDLSLVLQDSNMGPCLEVRTAQGMSGGCGGDFDEPLSISTGGIGDATFATGWGPPGTAKIEMTFPGGEIVKVTTFEMLQGYDVLFFIAPLPPTLGRESSLPLQTVAFDAGGNTLATINHAEESDAVIEGEH